MLQISEPIIHHPDRACAENNWANYSYTFQIGTCSAGDWSYRVEKLSSEYNQANAEAEITDAFNTHKPNCIGYEDVEFETQSGVWADPERPKKAGKLVFVYNSTQGKTRAFICQDGTTWEGMLTMELTS